MINLTKTGEDIDTIIEAYYNFLGHSTKLS